MDSEQLLVLVHPHPDDDYGVTESYVEQAVEAFEGDTAVVSRNVPNTRVHAGRASYDYEFKDLVGQGVVSAKEASTVESYDTVFLGGGHVGYQTEQAENSGCLKRFYNQVRRHNQDHALVPELTYNQLMRREYDESGREQLVEQDAAYTVADLFDPDAAETLEDATNGVKPATLRDYTLNNFDREQVQLESLVDENRPTVDTAALQEQYGVAAATEN